MNNSTTICIDLAKEVFQVAVFNQAGKAKLNKEVTAKKMCLIIAQYPDAAIYMEACGSAHHWARRFTSSGHKVGLIPPHLAAKYRVGNKSDKNDVLSIYEACKNQQLHCVQIRTLEQQDIATLHKFREGYKKERNQIANRLRGFGREYGVNFALGINKLLKQVPIALEDAENEMTVVARRVIFRLLEQLRHVIILMKEVTDEIEAIAKQIDACQRLVQLPGIAWLGASMMYAKFGSVRFGSVRFGSAECFRRGRDASASIGLVPAHSGSGGKVTIGRITKRGDTYLRTLIINGARSLVIHVKEKTDGLSCWVRQLLNTKGFNKTIVAVANKLVRMATAMLKSGLQYRQPVAQ